MLSLIVGLFVLGLCFIALEVLVPGGILGLIGLLTVIGSWTLAFVEYGVQGGLLAIFAGSLVIGLALVIELKFLPRTAMGQRLFLKGEVGGTSQRPMAETELSGKAGTTVTPLAPTGVVRVDDREYEAFSMSGMVEKGARVEVVDYDNFRVRVKKV